MSKQGIWDDKLGEFVSTEMSEVFPMEPIKVFVYGTLLSGEPNNKLLETSEKLGDTKIGGFVMKDLGPFPACVEREGGTPILGEVWQVTSTTLARLDRLEGYPSFYDRKSIITEFGEAWIYFCNEYSHRPTIQSGSWKQYLQEKRNAVNSR